MRVKIYNAVQDETVGEVACEIEEIGSNLAHGRFDFSGSNEVEGFNVFVELTREEIVSMYEEVTALDD